MSEFTTERDLSERPLTTVELLKPTSLPEAGFQSYEELKNNAVSLKADFIADAIENPDLKYPKFQDLGAMDRGIIRLNDAIETINRLETDEEKADIIATSLTFRMAEMEYVKLLARVDFLVNENADEADVREIVEEARRLGEQLYGTPSEQTRDATFNEIWRQLDNKEFHPSAQKVYDELNHGFTWNDREIAGLPRPDNDEELPDFNHPSLDWVGEVVLRNNAEVKAIVTDFWAEKVEEFGEDYEANMTDVKDAFERVLALLDPEATSGVQIIMDPESTALSWETPLMAVKIGEKRPAITSEGSLMQKIMHELRGHGGRAIRGLQSELPVLGTGLYTNTARPDYLTFEEGFLSTIEKAIGDTEPIYVGSNLSYYTNISMIEQGADFRTVYETAWRWRSLLKLEDGEELTDEAIKKEKGIVYMAMIRIVRGTPVNIQSQYPDIKPLSFNKDLAYLNGRVLAMNHIKELYEARDEAGLMRLFDAKYDPTIPEQAAIVDKYL